MADFENSTISIIRAVKKWPCLYDIHHENFKNVLSTDAAWVAISGEIGGRSEYRSFTQILHYVYNIYLELLLIKLLLKTRDSFIILSKIFLIKLICFVDKQTTLSIID